MDQITKNCHFISRFLTKPWEQGERRLWYYDFDADSFGTASSKKLFAAQAINNQRVEGWLKRLIEDPLAQARPGLVQADPNALDDWRLHRAALLMLWLQGARSKSVNDHGTRRDLDALAAQSDEETDALAYLIRNDYDLAVVFTVADQQRIAPLFVPSTGIFPIVIKDKTCLTGWAIALGLPLDLICALVAIPKAGEAKMDLSRLPGSIANYSIGPAEARRVVVAPAVLAAVVEQELRDRLVAQRAESQRLLEAVSQARELVVDAFATIGVVPAQDGASRLSRPK